MSGNRAALANASRGSMMGHLVTGQPGHAGQRLRDVRSTDNCQAKRRIVNREKPSLARDRDSPGAIVAQRLVRQSAELPFLTRPQQAMRATAFRSREYNGHSAGPATNEFLEESAGNPFRAPDRLDKDPDVPAASQPDRKKPPPRKTPKRNDRADPSAIASMAASATAPSTHPPETEPAISSPPETASIAPAGPRCRAPGFCHCGERGTSARAMPGECGLRNLVVAQEPCCHGILHALNRRPRGARARTRQLPHPPLLMPPQTRGKTPVS